MIQSEKNRIAALSERLYRVSKKVRILRHLSWAPSVREEFFRAQGQKNPQVSYPQFDPTPVLRQIDEILGELGDSPVDQWFARQGRVIASSARMLSQCGQPTFFNHAKTLYGAPKDPLTDGMSTSLALAQQFDALIESFSNIDLGVPEKACHFAQTVADKMAGVVNEAFADQAPAILIEDDLSANALASSKRIRIRKGACFTDRDILQLINHEAYIHVGTSLNGRGQTYLPLLAASHPGTTRTQEGLAVFAEFITGSMDIDRMRRLSDRVLGIQMAIDGADFVEVYHYFLARVGDKEQSFENTRRVFRGGVITGGAPFTKDNVYLDGLLRVHNFFRAIVATKRVDCLPLLFCGKLDLEDIPILCKLSNDGLCKPPKYLPPWAQDKRFLLSYLAYSSFLNRIDMQRVKAHYNHLLQDAPVILHAAT